VGPVTMDGICSFLLLSSVGAYVLCLLAMFFSLALPRSMKLRVLRLLDYGTALVALLFGLGATANVSLWEGSGFYFMWLVPVATIAVARGIISRRVFTSGSGTW